MGFDIIKDAEKGIAALIDADAGVALGPILSTAGDTTAEPPVAPGERAADLLKVFVGGLGKDPSELNPVTLARYFDQFIEAISAEDEPDAAAPAAAAEVGQAADAEQRGEPAGVGEQGGLAGPAAGSDTAREQGAPADEQAGDGPVATGALEPSNEQAREAADPAVNAATAEADPQGTAAQEPAPPAAGGVPKV